jgi:hypothetical protein
MQQQCHKCCMSTLQMHCITSATAATAAAAAAVVSAVKLVCISDEDIVIAAVSQ